MPVLRVITLWLRSIGNLEIYFLENFTLGENVQQTVGNRGLERGVRSELAFPQFLWGPALPLHCLWRYHQSGWPCRRLPGAEPHASSSAAGSHHGCFLCPDAGGLLRPHWLPHALHRPLDHCSDHLPGGPASLRFCGQWRRDPLGDCRHVSTLWGGWAIFGGRLPSKKSGSWILANSGGLQILSQTSRYLKKQWNGYLECIITISSVISPHRQ